MEEVDEVELHVERIAALDLGKAALVACVRVPHRSRPGRRMQEVREYPTTTAELLAMAVWFRQWGVERVVMEATGDYWKGVYYLLEAEGFECWLVNAREVKNTPGRAKTDKLDAVWLAKVAERGMCRPSLVHPPEIRRLRDLTRYRRALVGDRSRERQRVEKLLEDAQIKIGTVLTDIHGVSGRAMMEALVAGRRDPHSLATLAKGRARVKTVQLQEALRGFFTDHHATMLRMMLDNTDRISAQITELDSQIEVAIAPFSGQAARLCDLPGVDAIAAAELIGEIGVDMRRFPTPRHLVSWAKSCPQVHESAGRSKQKGRGKGNPWIAGTVGRIVFSLSRTDTFLGERYRRLAKRRGKPKAVVATGNSALIAAWHLLSDPTARFTDLGPGHFQSRINAERRARSLATQLQALTGQKITIRDGKALIDDTAA
ncbi:IS110 family transposase (plasmid) [Rhodococcus sp. ZPP]|uniref:IS110 family transposase n=1 Tax=unclassified Rhodococcus (in: high G+C Gram-positive bacteria) TaxID=192944 RepID=UPI00131F917E|nr:MULTISPECIES: IS110 family transposase [unclassified Rhodococcus (in: high G+C Gram-positive bacteria)]QHE74079.1 Mobile element protein [Rhodococcus sp. WAY2]QTJ71056.1 IS110 family transposase [Rhodococcus sp. ZPP]